MAMRQLNIDEELLGYAKSVLERDGIPYKASADGTLAADLDDVGEELLIEDALTEMEAVDPIPGIEPGMSLVEMLKIAHEYQQKKWAEQSKQGDQKT